MLAIVLVFLAAALIFYVLFAGADFGAGILELFNVRNRSHTSAAIAPVWEANHVWLILVVVILFMGFPTVYTTLSIHLWMPLMAVLVGIVGRGTAFTFRHYDPRGPTRLYSALFSSSSLWTSAWLGVTAGAAVHGRVDPTATTVWDLYLAPWVNPFCLAMAVFVPAAFTLLAAVYLAAEVPTERTRLIRSARVALGVLVATGIAVFWTDPRLAATFASTPASLGAFVVATALLIPFWRTGSRAVAAALVTLVLVGWFGAMYPTVVLLPDGAITFPEAAAPPATLRALVGALIVGSCVIFPGLGYLFVVFKRGVV